MADTNYADWTVDELRTEATNRDLEGRSGLNKDELVAALEADDAGETFEAEAKEEKMPSATAWEAVDAAREALEKDLERVEEALDEVIPGADPETHLALKQDREVLLDALRGLPVNDVVPEEPEEEEEEATA
jgi:hypothetical protein